MSDEEAVFDSSFPESLYRTFGSDLEASFSDLIERRPAQGIFAVPEQPVGYSCPKCRRTLKTQRGLNGHLKLHRVKGDRKYKIPNLDPLTIYNFEVEQGTKQVGLAIQMKEAQVFGLPEAKFEAARVDLKKRHVEWDFYSEKNAIYGIYNVSGQVLILPIRGHGQANITLTQCTYNYTFDFDLAKSNLTGKDHMVLKNGHLTFNAGKIYIHLDNLFDGNKLLGDNMNLFLNENWREILREVGPAITDAISTVFVTILGRISELVPYEYAYLPGKP